MNKYMIWMDDRTGEFVQADRVIISNDTVSFIKDDEVVRVYSTEYFLKNNPDWKLLENTE